jgi:glyoxylase-like metal-dependent hydrolase (beta-lactamase superfamily II)
VNLRKCRAAAFYLRARRRSQVNRPEPLLDYPFAAPPAPGEVREVAPGVHWLRMPLPFALDHINLWALEDGAGLALVDTGLGDDATRDLWQRVFDGFVKGRRVTRVIATHLHPDHAGNAGWLTARFRAPLWMSQSDYLMAHAWREDAAGFSIAAMLAHLARHGLAGAPLDGQASRGGSYAHSVPDFPRSYRRIMDGDALGIGGRAWRVVMGYGHAPEHASLYCGELGVLISGDMLLPRISTNVSVNQVDPDADPLALFLASLERYTREVEGDPLVLPSHGLPFRGMRTRVGQLEAHHAARLEELEDACAAPKSAADVIGTLFRRRLDVHQTFFAMGEALAHLNYLMYAGRFVRQTDADGVVRFVRAGSA